VKYRPPFVLIFLVAASGFLWLGWKLLVALATLAGF
jgi:hypothetical protein